MESCVRRRPFAHENELPSRLIHFATHFDRFDNFYNGYNTDCQMRRVVCCNPFQLRKCCQYCCGNN